MRSLGRSVGLNRLFGKIIWAYLLAGNKEVGLDFSSGTALVALEVCANEAVLVWNKRTRAQKNVQRTQNCSQ